MAKKRKIRWDRLIPLIILGLLLIYLIFSLLIHLLFGGGGKKTPKDDEIYTLCNLSARKTLQLVEKEDKTNAAMLKDYNFYGESLNLYYETYDREMADSKTLAGQTVALVDMCDGHTLTFDISREVDSQINIGKLTPGFYSVYTVSGEEEKTYTRLYFDRSLYSDNIAYSVTRDDKRVTVELIANKRLFDAPDAEESVLDQPYLYLKVTSEEVDPTTNIEYDVAIVTAPALTDEGVSLVGEEYNGYVEAKELWDVAEQLKRKLEAYDLKVLMGKDEYDQGIMYYDTGGVAYKCYKARVKYLIYLDMTTDDNFVETLYSTYSSDKLARSIYTELVEIGLYKGDELNQSYKETDGLSGPIDYEYEIRETGGKALGAGTYSEWSRVNAPFAANNLFGINTVKIVTSNIRGTESMNTWTSCKDRIADAITKGFMNYLGN